MAVPTPKEEILAILRGINVTGESLGVNNASEASNSRRTLLQEAKKLVAALEDPYAEVWPRAFQVNVGVSVSPLSPPGVQTALRVSFLDLGLWGPSS